MFNTETRRGASLLKCEKMRSADNSIKVSEAVRQDGAGDDRMFNTETRHAASLLKCEKDEIRR